MNEDTISMVIDNLFKLFPLIRRKFMRCKGEGKFKAHSPTLHVLRFLHHQGKTSLSEVGNHFHIAKPNMTSLVDRLLEDGLVERVRDEEDRRVVHISLLPKGVVFLKNQKTIIKNGIKETLLQLSESELKELSGAVSTMKTLFQKLGKDEEVCVR